MGMFGIKNGGQRDSEPPGVAKMGTTHIGWGDSPDSKSRLCYFLAE